MALNVEVGVFAITHALLSDWRTKTYFNLPHRRNNWKTFLYMSKLFIMLLRWKGERGVSHMVDVLLVVSSFYGNLLCWEFRVRMRRFRWTKLVAIFAKYACAVTNKYKRNKYIKNSLNLWFEGIFFYTCQTEVNGAKRSLLSLKLIPACQSCRIKVSFDIK